MSAKPAASNRPLSPFMIGPYYRAQLSSMLSITHRLTGLVLSAGTLFIAAWLVSAANGPDAYYRFGRVAFSVPARVLMIAWSWALFYHLCNGIRHLMWDVGYGFERKAVDITGWATVVGSIVLTVAVWSAVFFL